MFELSKNIRSISTEEIQGVIAEALSNKLGIKVECSINKIDYTAGHRIPAVGLEVTISEPFQPFSDPYPDDGQPESA